MALDVTSSRARRWPFVGISLVLAGFVASCWLVSRAIISVTVRDRTIWDAHIGGLAAGGLDTWRRQCRLNLESFMKPGRRPSSNPALALERIVPERIQTMLGVETWTDEDVNLLIEGTRLLDAGPSDSHANLIKVRQERLWCSSAATILAHKLALGDFTQVQAESAKLALLSLRDAPSPMDFMTYVSAVASTPLGIDPEWFALLKIDAEHRARTLGGPVLVNTVRHLERLRAVMQANH